MIKNLTHRTAVIIDDEASIRVTISSLLEKRGYTCITAATLTEAACILGRHRGRIDAIIADFEFKHGLNIALLAESMQRSSAEVFVLTSHDSVEILKDHPELQYANFHNKSSPLIELMNQMEP